MEISKIFPFPTKQFSNERFPAKLKEGMEDIKAYHNDWKVVYKYLSNTFIDLTQNQQCLIWFKMALSSHKSNISNREWPLEREVNETKEIEKM